jgi:uncharacterized radical SAM superfamily Fe-S cluster-containing enzyme
MQLSKFLFWDIDIAQLDYQKHASYIVDRVLSMGTMHDFQAIKAYYGKTKLKRIVKKLRYMDNRVLHFCSAYFNIPITEFRCYTIRQSNPAHWNY